jgi:hypothetical protein
VSPDLPPPLSSSAEPPRCRLGTARTWLGFMHYACCSVSDAQLAVYVPGDTGSEQEFREHHGTSHSQSDRRHERLGGPNTSRAGLLGLALLWCHVTSHKNDAIRFEGKVCRCGPSCMCMLLCVRHPIVAVQGRRIPVLLVLLVGVSRLQRPCQWCTSNVLSTGSSASTPSLGVVNSITWS